MPSQRTTLGLFRHGQTDWNIDFRLQGITETELNHFGVLQVKSAAPLLSNQKWDVLLSSPLLRARQTSEILAANLGFQDIIESPLLIERSFGIGEGMTYQDWQMHFASLDEIPGAETAIQVELRAAAMLEWVAKEFAGKNVLAVSHGALIRYVLAGVTNGEIPPVGERLQNASLHLLHHASDRWRLEAWRPQSLAQI